MKITVRYFTSLREIVGEREEILTFQEGKKVTVDLVLKSLATKHGASFSEYVYSSETGQPKGFLQFLVNGTSTSTLSGLQTELKDNDVMAILPPVGGG